MTTSQAQEPLDFLKTMWGNMGFSLPGMVTPTLDTDELGRRITDLKAVEGWLKANLNLLQMTIQGLEVQRSTLVAMQAISQSAGGADADANPFANPALWPWNFMQQASAAVAPAEPAPAPGSTSGAASDPVAKAAPEAPAKKKG